jgi:chaperonin GroEL
MAKQTKEGSKAREALQDGINKLGNAVKGTLGPRGRGVVLERKFGSPMVIDDGVTIAREIDLEDPFENMGAQLVKEVSSKTNDIAGDGTTTATLLAQTMVNEGTRNLAAGASGLFLKRGIDKAVKAVTDELRKIGKPVNSKEDQERIATIASNDPEIGKLIADAMHRVGSEGVITVEEGKTAKTELEVVEGMQFDRGYISPYFVTDPERMECSYEDAIVVITDKKFSSTKDIVPLLEKITTTGNRPFLLIAENVDGEALATIIVNKIRGTIKPIVVRAPGFGDRRSEILEDIAVLTGGKVISESLGLDLERVSSDVFGSAKSIRADKENTTIVGGRGEKPKISDRAASIRTQIDNTTADHDREKLQERLAKLTGGVAVINVGAATETEMKAKKAKVEDATNATKAGVEEGIVPGGGVALLRAQAVLDQLELEGDEATGARIVRVALETPLRQLAENSGLEPSVVVNQVRHNTNGYGLDAETGEITDMFRRGIVDPVKVTRVALENAASIAGTVLTTSVLVAELPEPDKAASPQMAGGMSGMGY